MVRTRDLYRVKVALIPAELRPHRVGAENETRTRNPHLGKVVLYQLSYFRKKMVPGTGIEPVRSFGSRDFKSLASASSAIPALMEAAPRFELGNKGFADLCLTTWRCRHRKMERKTRLELATPTLARWCSTN